MPQKLHAEALRSQPHNGLRASLHSELGVQRGERIARRLVFDPEPCRDLQIVEPERDGLCKIVLTRRQFQR